ncbi:Cation-dependent mannose-6-phosphate receptor [Formica fusca]
MYSNATFIVFALFLTLFCDTTSSECTQMAPCICTLPDGHYYNLTGLANELLLNDTQGDYTVYFHPCTNVQIMTKSGEKCANGNNVSICMLNQQTNMIYNLGTIKETKMKMSSGNKFPIFEIHHDKFISVINIVCFTDSKTNFKIDSGIPPSGSYEYHFMLVSPYGCKIEPLKGLSVGSILVILFFTVVGTYFIGGIITLRILRGATGWEMLPNHDFWSKLPLLVRDGIVFTFNCCRADSYERI